MSKQAFEKKLAELEALRTASAAAASAALRKALKDRSNYLVSKAAAIAGDLRLDELIPDLAAAFDRFFADPVKSDPQCWAKTAIAKALKDLGHRDAGLFLRGMGHVQLEPSWGGATDSAATLRGTCTLALVDCPLDDLEILAHFADRLADPETPVRMDAALAIAQLARPEGTLLLRLKILMGDPEPQVVGQCFECLLSLDAKGSLSFISRFLESQDQDVCAEAAGALAASRETEALEILKMFWRKRVPAEIRKAVLISLGASPLREAAEFLLSVLAEEAGELAAQAVASLATSRFHAEVRERTQAAVAAKKDPALERLFENKYR